MRRSRQVAALCFLSAATALAQDTGSATATVRVRVVLDSVSVSGALVRAGSSAVTTGASGVAVLRLTPGAHTVIVAKLGFHPESLLVAVRPDLDTTIVAALTERAAEISTVMVTSARIERRLEEEPLRVEVLAGEDVTEKTDMRPADLRTLFREMSGVRVQTTSPSLGAATVRVQGLRGRYTAVLNDGLPLYGTQASGFGLVQQPPLDLRQVEVIKGAASALYGPSALGGVVNLLSRRPPDSSQVLVNQTASGGSDVLAFLAHPVSSRVSLTTLAGAHYQRPIDADGDNWSDISGFRRAEIRPRLFYRDSAGRSFMITAGGFAEERAGGPATGRTTLAATADSLGTRHGDIGAVGHWRFSQGVTLASRLAANLQTRRRLFSGRLERERQRTVFGEVTVTGSSRRQTFLAGVAWQQERYENDDVPRLDETLSTPAVFVQHGFRPASWLSSTVNGRCDASDKYGTICSPRASVLARAGEMVSVRASIGGGWFAPMTLNEETEVIGLSRVSVPVALEPERARTTSLDVTATRGPVQVNGTLFANRVARPVGLRAAVGGPAGSLELVNAPGVLRTRGAELFAVYNREPVIATAYYATMQSRELSPETGSEREIPMTPRSEAGLDLALEEDEAGAYVALEVFYTGLQSLDDNPYRAISRPYVTYGLLGSKRFGRATVFLNVENLSNVRQSQYDPIVRPSPGAGARRAVPAWAPLDGRIVNGGLRYAF